jgi:hypothetical protein
MSLLPASWRIQLVPWLLVLATVLVAPAAHAQDDDAQVPRRRFT